MIITVATAADVAPISATGQFSAYGPSHLAALVVFAIGSAALVWIGRRQTESQVRLLGRGLGALTLTIFSVALVYKLLQPAIDHSVPLQLCDLAELTAAYALWSRRKWASTLVYYSGLPLSSQALDAIYYGGTSQAGVKLAKQAYEVIPDLIKGGGDGVHGASFQSGGGFPAIEGWYSTIAGPHLLEDPEMAGWVTNFTRKYGTLPGDYALTAYDAALVVLDAIKRVAENGKAVNRSNVRDAMQTTNLKTLQGIVSFDENGDIKDRTVSVFHKRDPKYPDNDIIHQQQYLGPAPQS